MTARALLTHNGFLMLTRTTDGEVWSIEAAGTVVSADQAVELIAALDLKPARDGLFGDDHRPQTWRRPGGGQ